MTTPTPHSRSAALGAILLAALAAGACSDSSDKTARAESGVATTVATAAAPRTTSPQQATASTTAGTVPAAPRAVRDWDGARFDIGVLQRIDRTEDGQTLIVFDRMQLETETGRKSGKDFTTEPIVFGNTDMPFVNDSTALRTYVAQPGMEVLRIVNVRETCADSPDELPARWEPVTVDRVVDQSLWNEYPQVSLTFSTEGLVSRLRLATGC